MFKAGGDRIICNQGVRDLFIGFEFWAGKNFFGMIGGEKRRSIVAAYVTKAFAEENSVDGGRKCVVGYDWLSVGVLGVESYGTAG